MKKLIIISTMFLLATVSSSNAQEKTTYEKYGKTVNFGAGIGYDGFSNHSLPVVMLNYEFDVARNFTLAPFTGIYTYQNYYYQENISNGVPTYRSYSYHATEIPVGVKATYYFDQLLRANPKWDFYSAGSAGFLFRNTITENGYYGNKYVYQKASPLYLDVHIGAEYHMGKKAGVFLDLSTNISTIGLALHL